MTLRIEDLLHSQLCIIHDAIPDSQISLPLSFVTEYERILENLKGVGIGSFVMHNLGIDVLNDSTNPVFQVNRLPFISKLRQLISRLELLNGCSRAKIAITSIYESIEDAQLKSRCSDLLSVVDHFDRVINQATQVLEDRVRKKIPSLEEKTGMALFGKAINPEPSKSMIVFSSNPSEQEGYANLFKGLMGTFRNQSHHKFLETVTREQALQICAFIDNMLAALESAQISPP
jgi:hypothetical protein